MNISNLAVSVFINIGDKIADSLFIVKTDGCLFFKNPVNRHNRQFTPDQFYDFRMPIICICQNHTIHSPVSAMLEIGHGVTSHFLIDENDFIAPLFHCKLESIEYLREKFIRQSRSSVSAEQNTYTVASLRAERSCRSVWKISHFIRNLTYSLFRLFSDITFIIQCLADSSHGYTTALCQFFNGNHICTPDNFIYFLFS